MIRLTLAVLFLVMLIPAGSGPALALDAYQECNVTTWEDKETHTHKGVTCQIKVQMRRNKGCSDSAVSFELDMDDYWNKKKTQVVCDTQTPIFMGNQYTCRWNSQEKKFNWMSMGTRAQTCQILIEWVQANP